MNKAKFKILLVEDDPEDAEVTVHALSKLEAFDLYHIDDGPKALAYLFDFQTEMPSAIMLDLKMPKVDGIEILSRLKSDPEKKSIPVFVLISSLAGQRYVQSYGLQPEGYLVKPVECQSLIELIAKSGLSNFSVPVLKPEADSSNLC